jgi:hypothetical protein
VTRSLRTPATSSLAIAPATVTDRTCAAVTGLEPRAFCELVSREKIPHARIGRRVVVRLDDFLAAVARLSSVAAIDVEAADEGGEEEAQPEDADSFLRSIGRRRSA